MSYHIGFLMDQIAGHVTNYHNLRKVTTDDTEIRADWHELYYYQEGGAIEKIRERLLPFIPTYFSGILRGAVLMNRGLKQATYDAIFTNATVGVFFSRAFRRVPTMIDLDSTPRQLDQMASYTAKRDPKPIEALKFQLFRSKVRSAVLLQAWSHWAKQSLINDYGVPSAKIVVNPPGVNLHYWQPQLDARTSRQGQALRILFVGGDFRRKGGEQLLAWYRTQDSTQYELHVVTREAVEARPGLHIYQNMQPNSQELLRLYQQSDLFVLPSLGECFGIATVEAMAAGLPVIASDVGGTADIIEPGRNGYIVPANNVAELGHAINMVLANAAQRNALGIQSRQLAEERFDLEINARRTLDYLKQIARRAPLYSSPTQVVKP